MPRPEGDIHGSVRGRLTTADYGRGEHDTSLSSSRPEDIDMRSSTSSQNVTGGLNDLGSIHTSPNAFPTRFQNHHLTRSTEERHDQTSLFARLQRVVAERTDSIKQEVHLEDGQRHRAYAHFSARAPSPHSRDVTDPGLPPRELSDHLVATYLSREYVNLPIFDLLDFRSAYEDLCNCESLNEDIALFYGILNIIFSLACLSMRDVNDSDASTFYSRGHRFINSSDDNRSSLAHVQAYILQSQYLNAIGSLKRAWATIGLAIHTAQSLGLHLRSGSEGMVSRKDRELARKLWHSCVIMERITALQLGISPQTSDPFRVPLPTPLDNEYVDTIFGGQPSTEIERPSIIEFFTACTRLYSHVEDILSVEDEFRLRNSPADKKLLSLDLQQFLRVDRLLYNWKMALPSFLRVDAANEPQRDPIVTRQRNILRIRYLYIRLRQYRPLFILAVALAIDGSNNPEIALKMTDHGLSSTDMPLVLTLARECVAQCVSAAVELVEILGKAERILLNADEGAEGSPNDSYADFVPSPWETTEYLYVCGIILIAASMCPSIVRIHKEQSAAISAALGQTFAVEGEIACGWALTLRSLTKYRTTRLPETTRTKAALCLNALITLSDASKDLQTTMSRFDSSTRERLLQRIEAEESQRRRLQRRSRAADASLSFPEEDGEQDPQTQMQRKHVDLSWLESLPVDLGG